MPWFSSSSLCSRLRSWVRDYDRIQSLAVTLLYIQIGCALLGSLSALFNGVLLINLVVALFALVAIESSSQSLGRSYAVLLACAIMLDIFWFIFFSHTIWNVAPEKYGRFFAFSVKLALSMQIIGFSADPSLGKPRTNAALLTDKFQSSSRGHLDFGTCSITSFEPF